MNYLNEIIREKQDTKLIIGNQPSVIRMSIIEIHAGSLNKEL